MTNQRDNFNGVLRGEYGIFNYKGPNSQDPQANPSGCSTNEMSHNGFRGESTSPDSICTEMLDTSDVAFILRLLIYQRQRLYAQWQAADERIWKILKGENLDITLVELQSLILTSLPDLSNDQSKSMPSSPQFPNDRIKTLGQNGFKNLSSLLFEWMGSPLSRNEDNKLSLLLPPQIPSQNKDQTHHAGQNQYPRCEREEFTAEASPPSYRSVARNINENTSEIPARRMLRTQTQPPFAMQFDAMTVLSEAEDLQNKNHVDLYEKDSFAPYRPDADNYSPRNNYSFNDSPNSQSTRVPTSSSINSNSNSHLHMSMQNVNLKNHSHNVLYDPRNFQNHRRGADSPNGSESEQNRNKTLMMEQLSSCGQFESQQFVTSDTNSCTGFQGCSIGDEHPCTAAKDDLYRGAQQYIRPNRRFTTVPNNQTLELKLPVITQSVDMSEVLHLQGRCKPCAFYYNKKKGCRNGEECEFCHHEDHSKLTLKQWKRQQKPSRFLKVKDSDDSRSNDDDQNISSAPRYAITSSSTDTTNSSSMLQSIPYSIHRNSWAENGTDQTNNFVNHL